MAVRIRLARRGRKKLAKYDVVVADARSPRDGKFIEKLGTYDPLTVPATITIKENSAFDWLMKGAQPSDTVRAIFSYRGIMLKRHLQVGVLRGAITQEQADEKLLEWKTEKEAKISLRKEKLVSDKQKVANTRRVAEAKIKDARAELLKKKADIALAKEKEDLEAASASAESENPETPKNETSSAPTEKVADVATSEVKESNQKPQGEKTSVSNSKDNKSKEVVEKQIPSSDKPKPKVKNTGTVKESTSKEKDSK